MGAVRVPRVDRGDGVYVDGDGASGDATFTLQTKPTPLQQRCFELLGVTPRM